MKQITCAALGGPSDCTTVISGNTPDEMISNGMAHVTAAHPDMAEGMKTMTKEMGDKWKADFMVKWAATPDM